MNPDQRGGEPAKLWDSGLKSEHKQEGSNCQDWWAQQDSNLRPTDYEFWDSRLGQVAIE
jgi:hypothetical protein